MTQIQTNTASRVKTSAIVSLILMLFGIIGITVGATLIWSPSAGLFAGGIVSAVYGILLGFA